MKHKFLFLAVLLSTLFTTGLWAQTPGYALYGDVPYGYEDLTSKIVLPTSATVDAGIMSLTGIGLPSRLCESNYLSFSLNEAVSMTLTSNYAIHVVLKRAASDKNVQIVLCKNGWNAARAAFELPAASISADDYADVTVAYGDRRQDNWNSYGDAGMIDAGGVSFPAAEVLRMAAENSEVLYISQIYIDADATSPDPVAPVAGDIDAPESLTLAASNILDKSVTLTASATDENSPISYTFYYKAAGDADFTEVAGAVAAASGADAVKVVSGLAPETNYSFKVVATDPSSNPTETTISGVTTLAAFKNRFYFFRAGDIPEIEGVNIVDLREGVGTTIQLNNMSKTTNVDYIHYALNGSWFSFNQNLSASTDMSIVEQSTWYLCVKMRTELAQNSFNLRLNNAGECWMISSSNLPLDCDGSWETLALPLSTSSKTLTFTSSMTGTIFQMHANGSAASDYIDIAYAYLTDDPLMDEKPAIVDNTAPANFSVKEKLSYTTQNSTVLQLYAEDEDTPLTYTISYAVKNSGDTPVETSVNGAQGTTVEKLISGLAPSTTYTFSVVASDPNGNETAPAELDITTTGPAEHRFYLVRGDNSEALPSSATLTSTLVNCNVEFGNSARDARISEYVSLVTGNTWMAVTFKPTAAVANTINDEWYIVVRMRNSLTNSFDFNRFRLNLVNSGQNWYINNSDSDKPFGHDYNDNGWVTITKKIGDRRSGTGVPSSFLATGDVAAQLHVDNNLEAGEYFDIDYIYFTDDITSLDPGTQTGKKIVIKEGADNSSVLSTNDGQTVDAYLRRTLSSASFNTFCVPFDMSAAEVEETFGAGVVIGKLGDARVKDNDELYLNFEFVDELEAGVPYIIQPVSNVANPLLFAKTIDKDTHPTEIENVAFKGVISPYAIPQQSAESHTILLLGAENTLSWPNASHNIKGMRAYFETSSTVAHVARRARFGFNETEVATGFEEITNDPATAHKLLINGQVIIIRNGEKFTVMGQHIQ